MNKNKGFISIGFILAIILGIVVIGGGAYYLGTKKNMKVVENNSHEVPAGPYGDETNYVAPPILNPLVSATNSAQIIISGKAFKDQTINLYINNSQTDQIQTDKNGVFVFTETLKSGDNQIKAKAENNGKQSDFSNVFDVVLKNSAPTLDISTPSDGQRFDKNSIGSGNSISVSGKTDQGVSVTVNGFWAVVDDSNNFSYTLPLQNGDNQIKIIAIDQAGNKTEKDIKVNYSQ